MATSMQSPFGANTAALALTNTPDVNAGTKAAGLSFGRLLETTGLAVAESSRQLNEVGADMTTALSSTMVDVIAAQVNTFNDQGQLIASGTKTLTNKLPLINFIDPVFYEWTQVRLQGLFQATEFAASNETSTTVVTASAGSSNTGTGFFFGAGTNRFSFGVSNVSTDVDTATESSFGLIRASALLQPKTDIGVPKPRQLLNAPSFAIVFGPDVTDVPAGAPTARRKEVSIQCFKSDGSKQPAAKVLPVSLEVVGAQWSFAASVVLDAGRPTLDANGQFGIVLERQFPTPPGEGAVPDTAQAETTVTVRMGVVSASAVIRF